MLYHSLLDIIVYLAVKTLRNITLQILASFLPITISERGDYLP